MLRTLVPCQKARHLVSCSLSTKMLLAFLTEASMTNSSMWSSMSFGCVETTVTIIWIVSGASSYTRYREGIEIEVDTVESERRKNLALIVCSALILRCLKEGLYPSWDAQNMGSVHLAEKLGYEFDHTYVAYEVSSDKRTH